MSAEFRRDRFGESPNHLLNYGYMVLRAIVARAICAAGLHPGIGISHHNRYDPSCLASDLMEPFRQIVDRKVWHMVKETGLDATLTPTVKKQLLAPLTSAPKGQCTFTAAYRLASSVAAVLAGEKSTLTLPSMKKK